jgi:penicillin-binding protein 1A
MARRGELEPFLALHSVRRRKRIQRQRRRRRTGAVVAVAAVGIVVFLLLAGFGAGVALSDSCSLSSLKPVDIGANTFVYAADGSLLGSIPADHNRQPVSLRRMSAWLPKATVAVEDRRFYQHGGIDYEGILRALWADISAGKVVEGGSTITQQLVRNMYTGR